jgi:hypothetical protein
MLFWARRPMPQTAVLPATAMATYAWQIERHQASAGPQLRSALVRSIRHRFGTATRSGFFSARLTACNVAICFVKVPGTPEGTRTPDRWIRNPLLYPAELRAHGPLST